jgi:hypothetical protein
MKKGVGSGERSDLELSKNTRSDFGWARGWLIRFFSKHWVWVVLLLLTIPAWRILLQPGYLSMHDDMQAVRQLEMDKCFSDGQVPCRWVLDLGYGYGYPLFNYYPPMPYLLGEVVHKLGWGFLDTIKVVGILGFIASGVTMYLLAREFWGKWGGLVAAVFYVYAPYHAVDFYVRGAMNEFWAIAWFPLILWTSYRLIKENSWRWVPGLVISYALLLLSHNGMAMIFTIGLVGWCGLWMVYYGWGNRGDWVNWGKKILKLVISGVWAVALAGFFFLPVIFEQKYAHVETLVIGYFNYLAHFTDLNQLFIQRMWGFGESRFGPNDEMSFQIGHLHWIIGTIGAFLLMMLWLEVRGWVERIGRMSKLKPQNSKLQLKSKKFDEQKGNAKKCNSVQLIAAGYTLALSLFYAFMSHYRSAAIWKLVTPLEFLQFPWRFLAGMILGWSFLAGAGVWSIKYYVKGIQNSDRGVGGVGGGGVGMLGKWLVGVLAAGLIAGVVALNVGYFQPREWYPEMTDAKKFSGKEWQLEITSGIFDYLPIQLPLPPADPADGDLEIVGGEGEYQRVAKRSNYQEFKIQVQDTSSNSRSEVRLNTFYFPGWRYYIDGKEVTDYELDPEVGVPVFELPDDSGSGSKSEYQLVARFTDTPIRKVGNWLSLAGLGGLVGWVGVRTIGGRFIRDRK